MSANKEMIEEIKKIIHGGMYSKDCQYCDFSSPHNKRMGMVHHVKAAHPDKYIKKEDAIMNIFNQVQNKELQKHMNIYKWLLGFSEFPLRQKGDGAFYWRKTLLQKLKLINITF